MTKDFNMVENPVDKSTSSYSHLMELKKELAWVDIKNKYNIEDYFSRNKGPLYSWDNLRKDGIKVLARLDRFYSFSSSIQNPSSHITQYKIMGDSTFCDHHPISFQINLNNSAP